MDIQDLYRIAEQENIAVVTFSMPISGSMSIMNDDGSCCIGIDDTVRDNSTQERVLVAHELGHCITGSFYNKYAAVDSRQRHENRANKWAVRQLISMDDLDKAIADGCTEVWELAERFGVTEDIVRKAVCYYIYGNIAAELYF